MNTKLLRTAKSLVPAKWFGQELRLAARTGSTPRDLFKIRKSEEKFLAYIQECIKGAGKNGAGKYYSLSQRGMISPGETSDIASFFASNAQPSVFGTARQLSVLA